MDQRALFESCMRQAEYLAARWDCRKSYEWKTTVAIWALLVGGIYFVKKPLPSGILLELLAVMLILIAGYVWLWLKPLWKANDWDNTMGRFYRDQADAVMRGADHIADLKDAWPQPRLSFWKDWSMRFQILSLIALLILFFIVPVGVHTGC